MQSLTYFLRSLKSKTTSMNTCAENSSSLYISNKKPTVGGSALLIIDPQVDFVTGSLKVEGAEKDCERISQFISDNLKNLSEIYVTLDTHMNHHIAHPGFWVDSQGKNPAYFTVITSEEKEKGIWIPVDQSQLNWCKYYTKQLESAKRLKDVDAFSLVIWPPHCLIGTQGHCVEPRIMEALQNWEKENKTPVHYILKGKNSKTEHYSVFRAEVIVPEDPATFFNKTLYDELVAHDKIYVAGEASSHCVNFSVRDLVDRMKPEIAARKIIVLEDAMSPVPNCEKAAENFVNFLHETKVSLTSCVNLRAVGEGMKRKQSKDMLY